MLVKFAIDPRSLMGDADTILMPLLNLIDQWEFFGILVNFDYVDDELASPHHAINQNVRIAWNDVLKANEPSKAYLSECYRTGHPDDSLDARLWGVLSEQTNLQSAARELAAWRSELDLDLAVLEEATAYCMGVLHQNASPNLIGVCDGVEPTGLAGANRAAKFDDAKSLSTRTIVKGMNHDRLWADRFQRLATYSSEIVIIDQFALSDVNINGFVKLLGYIDQSAMNNRLILYSKPESKRNGSPVDFRKEIPKLRERLDRAVTRLPIAVHLLDPQERFHDRYIRFDHNVFTTGNGLATAFKGGNSVQAMSIDCTLKDDAQSLTDMKKLENRYEEGRKRAKWTDEDTLIAIN